MGVAGGVAGTFGIQPLVGAFGVPYQAAEPRDERLIRVPLRIGTQMSQGGQVRGRRGRGTSCTPALLNPRRNAPYVGEGKNEDGHSESTGVGLSF